MAFGDFYGFGGLKGVEQEGDGQDVLGISSACCFGTDSSFKQLDIYLSSCEVTVLLYKHSYTSGSDSSAIPHLFLDMRY